jgi:branched-chain amino acid transport system substrate-binding protein
MFSAVDLAMKEVNDSGKAANGWVFQSVRADSTCIDAAAATAAAERLITVEGVKGIIGGDCSGVTRAVLTNLAMPNGIVMISPSATSPALTTDPDDGLFFRTVPSDAREGVVMADILEARRQVDRADLFQQRLRQGPGRSHRQRLHRQGRHRHHQRKP